MACAVAPAAAADMHAAALTSPQRHSSLQEQAQPPTNLPGNSVQTAYRAGVGADQAMQQHQLQQLIAGQQATRPEGAPPIKVLDSEAADHPILLSFPSFSESATLSKPHAGSAQHDVSTAAEHSSSMHLQDSHACSAGSSMRSPAGDAQHGSWAASSSSASDSSPPVHHGAEGSCSQQRRVGVSLLSQQIACARSLAGSTVSSSTAAEAAGGASGRHKGEFLQYIQVRSCRGQCY